MCIDRREGALASENIKYYFGTKFESYIIMYFVTEGVGPKPI
jgi:hypothetical protein